MKENNTLISEAFQDLRVELKSRSLSAAMAALQLYWEDGDRSYLLNCISYLNEEYYDSDLDKK